MQAIPNPGWGMWDKPSPSADVAFTVSREQRKREEYSEEQQRGTRFVLPAGAPGLNCQWGTDRVAL